MRGKSLLLGLALALFVASPVTAGAAVTYHGYLTDAAYTCGGAPATGPEMTGEVWNVSVKGESAAVMVNAFYDGIHHASFHIPGGILQDGPGVVADFWGGIAEGGGTASVTGSTFTWAIYLGYDCTAASGYDALVYTGTVGR